MEVPIAALLLGIGYIFSKTRQDQANRPVAAVDQLPPCEVPKASQSSLYDSQYWKDTVLPDQRSRADKYFRSSVDEPQAAVVSPLTGHRMPIETFKTEHMVPFYGGSVKQPGITNSDRAYGSKLETFTGSSEYSPWGQKNESVSKPRFEPVSQGAINSSGRPVLDFEEERDKILATMQPSRNHNNVVAPGMEPELVGRPGVIGGTSGDVYLDAREVMLDRGLAPTVDDLRAGQAPKETFEGRVLPPQAMTSHRPTPPTLAPIRRGGNLMRELKGIDDLMRGPGSVTGPIQRPSDYREVRSTHREVSTGRFGAAMDATVSRNHQGVPTISAARRRPNADLPSMPSGHAFSSSHGQGSKDDHGRKNVLVYGNNRDVTSVKVRTGNFTGAFKALVSPVIDAVRRTVKETSDLDAARAFGNVSAVGGSRQPMLTVYDARDVARTSLKETTLVEANAGNVRPAVRQSPLVYDPSDIARTSMRETMVQDAPLGNLRGSTQNRSRDPNSTARTTFREGLSGASSEVVRNVSVGHGTAAATLPPKDQVSMTQRNIDEATRGTAYGLAGKTVPMSGHTVAQAVTNVPETQRQDVTVVNYLGQGQGATSPMSHEYVEHMRQSADREETLMGRSPAGQGAKVAVGADEVGVATSMGQNLSSSLIGMNFLSPSTTTAPCTQEVFRTGRLETRSDAHLNDRLVIETSATATQRVGNPFVNTYL